MTQPNQSALVNFRIPRINKFLLVLEILNCFGFLQVFIRQTKIAYLMCPISFSSTVVRWASLFLQQLESSSLVLSSKILAAMNFRVETPRINNYLQTRTSVMIYFVRYFKIISNIIMNQVCWSLTHVVSTLAADFSKWKLRTLLMLSACNDRTYNSPVFTDITNLSGDIKLVWAQSRVSFTSSCCSITKKYTR